MAAPVFQGSHFHHKTLRKLPTSTRLCGALYRRRAQITSVSLSHCLGSLVIRTHVLVGVLLRPPGPWKSLMRQKQKNCQYLVQPSTHVTWPAAHKHGDEHRQMQILGVPLPSREAKQVQLTATR